MVTHWLKSINWVDVALGLLFIRMIFIGVKNGFIAESFKFLGVVAALFFSLHYYSFLAAWAAQKTGLSWDYWDLAMFAGLWLAVAFVFKLLRGGMVVLFKVEAVHEGFNKYAAGILAVSRGILVCSLTMFLILLLHNGPLTRMTVHSYSYRIAGRATVSTYSFLYNHLVSKLFVNQHYNASAAQVLHPEVK